MSLYTSDLTSSINDKHFLTSYAKSWAVSLTERCQNVVMGGGSSTMSMWRTDMFEIGREIIRTMILTHFHLCRMRSFLIRMMSPIGRQPNLLKSFTELSFIVFSIYSKACTSTGSSIPREAAVTYASVGSICIIASRTAVTLVTCRTFVDIWSEKKNTLYECFKEFKVPYDFEASGILAPSAYKKASLNESPKV